MRFVRLATEEQQAVQAFHRVRSRLIGNRTALVNQIRGILLEYGVTLPLGVAAVRKALPGLLAEERWSALVRKFLTEQQGELAYWDTKTEAVTAQIKRVSATQPVCHLLEQVRGIGPLSASALWLNAVGQVYQNGRHLVAALGLVPRHTGISKRGDGISASC